MNVAIYNATVGAGVGLVALGAGVQWGWPVGSMVGGGLILLLSVLTLRAVR